ncbi:MAG TPA: MarR family transcriptional regulator, partial [Polyangiaceae bacterium]|nr:MarR family transcriptional regulator [Polyangiaceae bacterium]
METVTLVYATLGASLFVLGGVALRSMAVVRARQDASRTLAELEEARGRHQALERAQGELSMGDLSRRLMVTGGNVTAIVDSLERDGLVVRRSPASD